MKEKKAQQVEEKKEDKQERVFSTQVAFDLGYYKDKSFTVFLVDFNSVVQRVLDDARRALARYQRGE